MQQRARHMMHSTYSGIPNIPNIYKPGMRFVTIFCDDQKVSLPNSVVDVLSTQGEKVVPASIEKLHLVARELELRGIPQV
mmetsp:Transcript_10094/g.22706  ORF Transcript_10094/g.22706 Transcript_10094/m.22706 type:complete len:80 (+) Transcript_10094:106-345(+)